MKKTPEEVVELKKKDIKAMKKKFYQELKIESKHRRNINQIEKNKNKSKKKIKIRMKKDGNFIKNQEQNITHKKKYHFFQKKQ